MSVEFPIIMIIDNHQHTYCSYMYMIIGKALETKYIFMPLRDTDSDPTLGYNMDC